MRTNIEIDDRAGVDDGSRRRQLHADDRQALDGRCHVVQGDDPRP